MNVNCVEGCGDSLAIICLAVASVVVSLAAAVLAYKAWRVSVEQRNMQKVEHDALLTRLSAVALLAVEAHLLDDDSRDQRVEVDRFDKVLAIGINNRQGTKAANNVAVDVVAPTYATLRWSDANGNETTASARGASPTDETLRAGAQEIAAHYLDSTISTIPTSVGGTMLYVRVSIELGATRALKPADHPPTERLLPIKVVVSSDDLPPERRSVVVEKAWRFWRPPEQA
jgi:hypothetical protein